MDIVDRARRFWTALSPSQKILLSLVGALVAVAIVWGSSSAASEPMDRVVGREVDDAARGQVLQKLREKNQRYEIRDREIYVPKADAQRVVLELAGEGALSQQAVWKWLGTRDPFISRGQFDKRVQIALQQQLEMMIRKVDAVKNASVVISPAEEGGLFKNSPKAKASVVVELHPGRDLTSKNAQAIAGLVASAVPGLERDKVHITDSAGRPFRVGIPDSAAEKADTHREYERSIERDIEERLARMLGMMSFMVRVKAKASDSESTERRRDRPKAVEEEERRRIERAPSQAPPSGIKGDPTAPPPPPPPAAGQDNEVRTKYVFDEKEIRQRDPAGLIEKITVGVLYPVRVDKDGKEISTPGISLEDVRTFVVKAAGPPCTTDDVSVVRVPTRAPEALPETAPVVGAFAWLAAHWTKIALFAFAVLGLAVMARIVRGATAGGEVEEIRALATDLGRAVEAATRPPEGEPRQGLRELARQNPEAVAASLKTWMEAR